MTIYSLDVTPFSILNQSIVPTLVLTLASWPAQKFLRRQIRWSGIPISVKIFQFVVIHTIKGFSIVSEAEVDVFLEFSCFFCDPNRCLQFDLWFLCFFLNLIWSSGSSWFTYYSPRLAEFLALLCSHGKWIQLCGSLSILWHCPSLGLEWKLTFSSPVAAAEFSTFASILSAAFS